MNKEELLRIALSGKVNKSYKESLGFDDCERFLDGFNCKLNQGDYIPVHVVYLFYYNWVKDSGKKPEVYSKFVRTWAKHTKSIPWSRYAVHKHYRCYKIQGFPKHTKKDHEDGRKLVCEQKEAKQLKKGKRKKRRSNKKVLQPQS